MRAARHAGAAVAAAAVSASRTITDRKRERIQGLDAKEDCRE